MSDLDRRLRAALTDLGRTAQGQVRPAGSAGVPAAGRRRRRSVHAATGVLALVLAGGTTATAVWLTHDASSGASPAASATCAPVPVTVFLDLDGPAERRQKLEAVLAGPEITSVQFEGRTAGILSWTFTVGCADDFPAVKLRLEAVPVVGYTWSDPEASADPTQSGRPLESLTPTGSAPMLVCVSNGCTPPTPTGTGFRLPRTTSRPVTALHAAQRVKDEWGPGPTATA